MIKIGITGSLSSGKTTASKFLSNKHRPLFSADAAVRELYSNKSFRFLVSKKLGVENNNQIKRSIKKLVIRNKKNLKKLEKIIHPLVRKKMKKFTLSNKNKKILFYEIPLLIESKLMKLFDVIIFIKSKKKERLKRFVSTHGNKELFDFLNNQQLSDKKKMKFCDHIVVNEKNLKILKENLSFIIDKYE